MGYSFNNLFVVFVMFIDIISWGISFAFRWEIWFWISLQGELGTVGANQQQRLTVNCTATYETFTFDEGENILLGNVNSRLLSGKSTSTEYSHNSVRRTATVVFNNGNKIAFFTCFHIVTFSDTRSTYRVGADHRPTKYIKSVAVKVKQINFVSPFPGESLVDVLSADADADIAVVGRRLTSPPATDIPRFGLPLGNAKDLEWGTFVYVIG